MAKLFGSLRSHPPDLIPQFVPFTVEPPGINDKGLAEKDKRLAVIRVRATGAFPFLKHLYGRKGDTVIDRSKIAEGPIAGKTN